MNYQEEAPDTDERQFKPFGRDLAKAAAASNLAGGGPCRMTARMQIEQRINRLRREADGLEALLKALPMELPPAADEALWGMTSLR